MTQCYVHPGEVRYQRQTGCLILVMTVVTVPSETIPPHEPCSGYGVVVSSARGHPPGSWVWWFTPDDRNFSLVIPKFNRTSS